jgi:hypothetical protein
LWQSCLGLIRVLIEPAEMPKRAAVVQADDFYGNAVVARLTGKTQTTAGTHKEIDLSPSGFAAASRRSVADHVGLHRQR